jgi:hypothetical protein
MNHKGRAAFIAAGLGVLAVVPGRAAGPIAVASEGDRELARVVVDGRTVGVGTATNSGVWVRDMAVGAGLVPASGEYVRLTGQVTPAEEATIAQADAEALGLSVRSEYRSQEGGVGIDLTVTDRTGTERAVQVQVRIPLAADAGPWFWGHNVLSEQPLDAAPEHANYTMVDWGPRQAHTLVLQGH